MNAKSRKGNSKTGLVLVPLSIMENNLVFHSEFAPWVLNIAKWYI